MSNILVLLALIMWSMILGSEFTILYHDVREFTPIDFALTSAVSVALAIETLCILFKMSKENK